MISPQFLKKVAPKASMKDSKADMARDKKMGIKEGSKKDMALDMRSVKKTGTFRGKSNALGHGGRAAQLKAMGVPGGVIGELARKVGAAPGQANYHGSR